MPLTNLGFRSPRSVARGVRARWHRTTAGLATTLNGHGVPLDRNGLRLRRLKNKYKGRRCFVIGNGPSLKVSDLDLLRDEVTIASNKIFLAFDDTSWRPTLYTVIDAVVIQNIKTEILNLDLPAVYPDPFRQQLSGLHDVAFVPLLAHGDWNGRRYLTFEPAFSVNPLSGLYHGECVTYFNIQLAAYMGCNPIILLGVDFKFVLPQTRIPDDDFGYILVGSGEINHFSAAYRPAGESWTMPNLDEQRRCFEYATAFLAGRGVALLNASRATALDVVPRTFFDALFHV